MIQSTKFGGSNTLHFAKADATIYASMGLDNFDLGAPFGFLMDFSISGASMYLKIKAQNITLFADTADFGSGVGVLHFPNSATAPTSSPTVGGILYASSGTLYYRSQAGNIRTVAAV